MNIIKSILALLICTTLFACREGAIQDKDSDPVLLEFKLIKKGLEVAIENTEDNVLITNQDAKAFRIVKDKFKDEYLIILEMTKDGTMKMHELTGKFTGQYLAIIVDGEIVSSPHIAGQIKGDTAVISGGFTEDEAHRIASGIMSNK